MTPHTDSSSDWAQITRYVSGEATPDERQSLEQWVRHNPGRQALLEQANRLWTTRPQPTYAEAGDVDHQIARLSARIRSTRETELRVPRTPWRVWAPVALACTVLLLVAGDRLLRSGKPYVPIRSVATSEYKVYTTRPGQRATVELIDGTRVHINVGSTLEVPRNFGHSSRTVRLLGHAAFDVSARNNTPFIVDAAGTQTTVLGTEFSVRAYTSDVRVAVRSGKVSVGACGGLSAPRQPMDGCQSQSSRVTVAARGGALVTPAGNVSHDTRADVARDLAFTSGRLLLNGASLGEMIDDLNRWYDADIRVTDKAVRELRLGGWLSSGDLEEFMQYLTGALPVRVQREGRVVIVSPL